MVGVDASPVITLMPDDKAVVMDLAFCQHVGETMGHINKSTYRYSSIPCSVGSAVPFPAVVVFSYRYLAEEPSYVV